MASLSPLFRMCSGGRIRLFISSKYWWEQGAGGERNKGRQGVRTKKTSEWERKWIQCTKWTPSCLTGASILSAPTSFWDGVATSLCLHAVYKCAVCLQHWILIYDLGSLYMHIYLFFYNNTRTHGPPPLSECIKESTGSSKGITAPTRSAS